MRGGSAEMQKAAEALKLEANALFSKGKFAAAKEKYTEAITLCPDMPVLYVNRAMCSKKRNEPHQVADDAERALLLDKDNMKAHYLLGSSCHLLGSLDRAIAHLQKALEAAREKNDGIKDEIWHQLAQSKYAHWEQQAAARAGARQELQGMLERLCSAAETGVLDERGTPTVAAGFEAPVLPGQVTDKTNRASAKVVHAGLQGLLDQAREADRPKEVPSTLTCPLTMEVFRDPVITPAGHSYERSALLEHLQKVGKWDPVARNTRVTERDLIPNLNLRAAVQVFLDQHPYAWGECR